MKKTELKNRLLTLLPRHERGVDLTYLSAQTGRSTRTIRRWLDELISERHAPWYVLEGKVFLDKSRQHQIELEGHWFTSEELFSLLALYHLVESMTPGLLSEHFSDFKQRILELLGPQQQSQQLTRHVKLLPIAHPMIRNDVLNRLADAIARKQRLSMRFWNRADNTCTQRDITPLQLVRYRDRWLVDAWCHLREDLRSFSLEAIQHLNPTQAPAYHPPESQLADYFESSYGIFSGTANKVAVLNFSAYQARWIRGQIWHPKQTASDLPDGGYQLHLPYNNDLELIQDILKFGPEVEVIAPPELRQKVAKRLQQTLERYRDELA